MRAFPSIVDHPSEQTTNCWLGINERQFCARMFGMAMRTRLSGNEIHRCALHICVAAGCTIPFGEVVPTPAKCGVNPGRQHAGGIADKISQAWKIGSADTLLGRVGHAQSVQCHPKLDVIEALELQWAQRRAPQQVGHDAF